MCWGGGDSQSWLPSEISWDGFKMHGCMGPAARDCDSIDVVGSSATVLFKGPPGDSNVKVGLEPQLLTEK